MKTKVKGPTFSYFFKEPPQDVEMQETEREVIESQELDGTQALWDGGECGVTKHGQLKARLKVGHKGTKKP